MGEVSYNMVMNVNMSWDSLKRKPNFQAVAGETIFRKLFEMEPRAAGVFHFSPGEEITEDPVFKKQARVVVDMIDCAVNFLGPDMDSLTEDLTDLGRRHLRYGVHPDFLPVMAKAVVHTLKTMLGTRFADDDRKAWESILQFMVTQMKIGMAS